MSDTSDGARSGRGQDDDGGGRPHDHGHDHAHPHTHGHNHAHTHDHAEPLPDDPDHAAEEVARRISGSPAATEVGTGVLEIDTLLGGWHRVTAGYLVTGDAPVLVETGSQSSVPVLLAQLARLGLGAADLAGVVVSHIHLDHAGGVGDVARAFPNATVYVHAKGARHLADPTKLVDSASRVYGPLLDSLYGRLDPTPTDRIHVLEDLEEIRISSNRSLTAVDSPGHAKHHLALHDSESGLLFCGDAVGVKLPDGGVLRPSTPPPDFDLDLALRSLQRFAERRPTALGLAHYGILGEPTDTLEEADGTLRRWAAVAERAYRTGADIAQALAETFAADLEGVPEEHREKLEVMNGVHSNAAGFRRWLTTRDERGTAQN